jgi:hypothetical protein
MSTAQLFVNHIASWVGASSVAAASTLRLGAGNAFRFFVPTAADEPCLVWMSSSSESEMSTSSLATKEQLN